MTKAELLDRMSAAEITEWMGLFQIRNEELKEAQSGQGPQTKSIRQPRARGRR